MRIIPIVILMAFLLGCTLEAASLEQQMVVPSSFQVVDNGIDGYDVTGFISYPGQPAPTPTPTSTPAPTTGASTGSVSVTDYGAVGDGLSDDSVAIMAALATCRPVHFPAGVYAFGQTLSPAGCPDLKLTGDGPQTSILKYTGSTLALDIGAGSPGFVMRDLQLKGPGTFGHNGGVYGGWGSNPGLTTTATSNSGALTSAVGLKIQNVSIPGWIVERVWLEGWEVALDLHGVAYNGNLTSSVISRNTVGIKLNDADVTTTVIQDNEIANNVIGVWMVNGQLITIRDNAFEQNQGGTSVFTESGTGLIIEHNYFTYNDGTFIHTGAWGHIRGVIIEHNYLEGRVWLGDRILDARIADNMMGTNTDIKNEYTQTGGFLRTIEAQRNRYASDGQLYQAFSGAQAWEIIR